ncbi:ABC transporter permease [Henriciella sp.]|uniref:ABC transporter permease n=1 Tax=Henriciella sp. TaxID=1968823 RepID=UPI003C7184AF
MALVRKEVAQVSRDPSTYLIAFVLPLILLFIFGYGISLDNARTRVGLVVQDDSAAASSLATTYVNSRWFEVTSSRAVAPMRDAIVAGDIGAIIVIPDGFGKGVAQGNPPAIQVITDGSQPNNASFAASYAEGLRANWAANEGLSPESPSAIRVDLQTRFWFNAELKSQYNMVLGSTAIVLAMIGTLLTSLVIAREWERGTMEALIATPMAMSELLISKIIPYFILALISMTLCAVAAVFVFGVPFRGSILALLVISSAFLIPALGIGLLISAATKNQFVASQLALLSGFLPTFLLSGFLYEISSMPLAIQAVTYVIPARYLIPSLQTVFMSGDVWALFIPNIAAMLGFGLVFLVLTFSVTRRTLDT